MLKFVSILCRENVLKYNENKYHKKFSNGRRLILKGYEQKI